MDSNTTAGGCVPLLRLDPAAASVLQHVLMWAVVVCVIIVVVELMAFVINYFRGPKEALEEPAGCFPGGGDDGSRAPRQQQPAAVAAEVAIEVAGEDDAVPVVIICKADDVGGLWEPTGTCAVCQAELASGGALRAPSPCRHCFHSACAREWVRLHATCPLCQAPVAAGATV